MIARFPLARSIDQESMSAPTAHTTPSGSSFRISKIQDDREQSLFRGQKFVFQAEKESAEGVVTLEVTVTFSPIAIAIASPEDRLKTDDYAEELVKRILDDGNLQDVEIHVTSETVLVKVAPMESLKSASPPVIRKPGSP